MCCEQAFSQLLRGIQYKQGLHISLSRAKKSHTIKIAGDVYCGCNNDVIAAVAS